MGSSQSGSNRRFDTKELGEFGEVSQLRPHFQNLKNVEATTLVSLTLKIGVQNVGHSNSFS